MNIGIIIYSQTGHTLSVAQNIQTACTAAGHPSEIRRIAIEEANQPDAPPSLLCAPDIEGFDAVILAAPVHAFSLCPAMTAYLKQLSGFHDMPVGCFLTQGIPLRRLGGNRAYRTLRAICIAKGSQPVRIGHVCWGHAPLRRKQIADTVSGAVQFARTAAS